jgi:hypothetical protein
MLDGSEQDESIHRYVIMDQEEGEQMEAIFRQMDAYLAIPEVALDWNVEPG